jgi:hypothetical protein
MNIYKKEFNQRSYGFKGPKYQKGYGVGSYFKGEYNQLGYGIGGLFKRFLNWMRPYAKIALPIIKDGFRSIGKDVVKSASNLTLNALDGQKVDVINEIDNTLPKIKDSLKKMGQEVLQKTIINNEMNGSGIKKKRSYKKKTNHSKKVKFDIFHKFK